jgi:hypothetical protein
LQGTGRSSQNLVIEAPDTFDVPRGFWDLLLESFGAPPLSNWIKLAESSIFTRFGYI